MITLNTPSKMRLPENVLARVAALLPTELEAIFGEFVDIAVSVLGPFSYGDTRSALLAPIRVRGTRELPLFQDSGMLFTEPVDRQLSLAVTFNPQDLPLNRGAAFGVHIQ